MREIPTADEFLEESKSNLYSEDLIKFARLHVKAALKKASEIQLKDNSSHLTREELEYAIEGTIKYSQNVEGILNAYPLENIK